MANNRRCNLCKANDSELVSILQKPPEHETKFLPWEKIYYREIRKCNSCRAYFNYHEFDIFDQSFYENSYNAAIGTGHLEERFNKIISLPEQQSDNKLRVQRIKDFLKNNFNSNIKGLRFLDVGSGTGVFPYEMAKHFISVSAVDPDQQSVSLMRNLGTLENIWQGSIQDVPHTSKFDFISFNKVLEHLLDPFFLLNEAQKRLSQKGIIYIELPYAEDIIHNDLQNERAEFFIEHFVTYNYASINYLINKSSLEPLQVDNIIDPSGKHTIYAFCQQF